MSFENDNSTSKTKAERSQCGRSFIITLTKFRKYDIIYATNADGLKRKVSLWIN